MSVDNQLINRQPVNILSVLEKHGLREHMALFLDPRSIVRLSSTCRVGNEAGKSERIWEEIYKRENLEGRQGKLERRIFYNLRLNHTPFSRQIANLKKTTSRLTKIISVGAPLLLVGGVYTVVKSHKECLNDGFLRMVQSSDPIQGSFVDSYLGDCLVNTLSNAKIYAVGVITAAAYGVFKCFIDCRKKQLQRNVSEWERSRRDAKGNIIKIYGGPSRTYAIENIHRS